MSHTKKIEGPLCVRLDILRQKNAQSAPYHQVIAYKTDDHDETVAGALADINYDGDYLDENGVPVGEISWECSCMQRKCGACAMVIAGRPQLACGARLADCMKKGVITVKPLQKFPVLRDLIVDRTVMFENLKTMSLWAEQNVRDRALSAEDSYDASRCLQCGCCLEVCPNVSLKDRFFGAAGFVPAARLLSCLTAEDRERVRQEYLAHSYDGCGKSLACADICPAEIDITRLLLHTNAAAFRKEHDKT